MSEINLKQSDLEIEKNKKTKNLNQKTSLLKSEDSFVDEEKFNKKDLDKEEKQKIKANKKITNQFTKTKKRKSIGKNSTVQLTKQERKIIKEQETKEKELLRKQKLTWKKRLMNFGLLTLCGVVTGVGLGSWYYKNVLSSNVDWDVYLQELPAYEQKVVDTQNSAFEKILGSGFSEEDKEHFIETATTKGLTPSDFSMAENYQLANYNFTNSEKYLVQGTGQVKTIATQSIYNEKLFDGETYQFISISAGIMSIAEIAQMNKNMTSVTTVKGNDIQATSAKWTGTKNIYTASEFKNMTGALPNTSQNYLICEDTILNNSTGQITVIENEDGSKFYQFEMQLNIVYSVLNYIKQMKYTSALSAYPEFESIKQLVTIDENWNFVSIDCIEEYSIVAFGMRNNCTGTLLNYFYFNKDVVAEKL